MFVAEGIPVYEFDIRIGRVVIAYFNPDQVARFHKECREEARRAQRKLEKRNRKVNPPWILQ